MSPRQQYMIIGIRVSYLHTYIRFFMSGDRFYQILKYFKLYNKEEIDASDPTHKFSFFMNFIMENSQNLYIPYKSFTMSETMIKFSAKVK